MEVIEDTVHDRNNGNRLSNFKLMKYMITCWDKNEKEKIIEFCKKEAKYAIISDDDHTQEGQLHWHIFASFVRQVRASEFKTYTSHYEKSWSDKGCIEYCKAKGENYIEIGKHLATDTNGQNWVDFIEACKTLSPNELIDGPYSMLFARYRNFAGEIMTRFHNVETIQGELQNEWYWGETGTGKSRTAREKYPDAYLKNQNKWWDGYNHEETVIIEEWSPEVKGLTNYMKIWCDRYPFLAEIKGSAMKIRPKKIIVTSNYSIDECFEGEDLKAIRRRFRVTQFHKELRE